MPSLDVSFVTADPALCDTFDVIRRVETVSAKGRPTMTETTIAGQLGVVTQQDPSELMRQTDLQIAPRSIFIASRFAFQGASAGYQPDVIVWPAGGSTRYTVRQTFPYSRYGAGLHECVAEIQAATNPPGE